LVDHSALFSEKATALDGVCITLTTALIDRANSRRAQDMKKTIASLVAAATVAGSLVSAMPAARAENGQIAAGVAGGLIGGALLGGAIAASRPAPVYAPAPAYAPPPVYVEEPACRLVRERFWDGYGWRMRRVEVCN
jgi:hypothetical protein